MGLGIQAVVFMVGTGNGARSPMAAAMLRALDTRGRLLVAELYRRLA